MLELLDLGPGMKVLEIGTGTGYNASLLTEIVGDQGLVVTVDVAEDVVDQTRRLLARAGYPGIHVRVRDGFEGAAEDDPFDRIVVTVGCSDLSPRWAEQLADGGFMLVPLEHAGAHPLFRVGKGDRRLPGGVVGWSGFMPVRGSLRIENLWPAGFVRPDADEQVHERDPWPGWAADGEDPALGCSADEADLLFYLGIRDRRACWAPGGVGLSEGTGGWAVATPGRFRWWKDAALAHRLDRLHDEWLASGRPAIRDYRVAFMPLSDGDQEAPAAPWAIDRRFFREVLWLPKRSESEARRDGFR
jgi:protein-L-isoaspartate(D-aspartate) O-methyltransferase